MARRIFHRRRSSALSQAVQTMFGNQSIFGNVHKWILWFLHDGCYDGRVFDRALQDTFGDTGRIFDALKAENDSTMYSSAKMGVVATSIAKETWSFVLGNFNAAEVPGQDCGQS